MKEKIQNVITFMENHVVECRLNAGCGRCDEARQHVATLKEVLKDIDAEVERRIAEGMPSEEDKAIRKFFIWMVREANIEVIDAETAIEVHSLASEVGLVPVISIDELIEYFRSRLTSSEKPNNSEGGKV